MDVKKGFRMWAGFIWLRIGPAAGSCKHDNEPAGLIKGGIS
jgi:hypothetical protein